MKKNKIDYKKLLKDCMRDTCGTFGNTWLGDDELSEEEVRAVRVIVDELAKEENN